MVFLHNLQHEQRSNGILLFWPTKTTTPDWLLSSSSEVVLCRTWRCNFLIRTYSIWNQTNSLLDEITIMGYYNSLCTQLQQLYINTSVMLNLWLYCKHNLKRFPTPPVVFVSVSSTYTLGTHFVIFSVILVYYIIVVLCSRVSTWLTPWDASPTPPVIPVTASSASSLANQRDILVFSTATRSLPKLLNRYRNLYLFKRFL